MSPQQTIAHYRVTAKLGEGGMGEVWRATDTRLGRDVALKILPAGLARDPERMARFEREAKVLASLNHPYIAQIYGIEERALVMELVEGEMLQGPLPLDTALEYARQIADALEAAHEKGIVHRDLKPGNIMVTAAGVVKVLDFGLAFLSRDRDGAIEDSPTETISPTRAGVILGTAPYMSPEQARGKVVDKRADIWAFGCVLYEMLTGQRAFTGETTTDILAAVVKSEPDLTRAPAKVRRLLGACLQKDPKRRLRDIGDAWRLLEDEVGQEVGQAVSPANASQSRAPWIAAAALAIIAIAGWTLLWRATHPVDRPLTRFSVDLGPDALPGPSLTAAISPDGRRLVYVARGPDGKQRLATRLLDQAQATLLPGTENGSDPFFSPDGQWIGFAAGTELKKISAQGGAPVTLASGPTGIRGASWSKDGNIIAALGLTTPLSRVPADGGPAQPLTRLGPSETAHRWPHALPGGDTVLFTASAAVPTLNADIIEAISLKTGQVKVLQRGGYYGRYLPGGYLVFVRQGMLFGVRFDPAKLEVRGAPTPLLEDLVANPVTKGGQFDSSSTGTFVYSAGKTAAQAWQLGWLDSSGKTEPLVAAPGPYTFPRLSPVGRKLAFAGDGPDVYVHDLERDTASRLTFTGNASVPVWTPDAKHIVYRSASNDQGLYWIRSDGAGEPQRLLESQNNPSPSSFSPDGRRLAYQERSPETGFDLWTVPLDITDPDHPKPGKPEPFLRTAADEDLPRFSPDGRWIAYTSNESGRNQIYVRPFPAGNGGKWQISSGGGLYAFWANNGRELFYETLDYRIMMVNYTVDGASFVPGKPRLWSDKQLFHAGSSNLDLAPDGKRFVVLTLPETPAGGEKGTVHVTVLENFFDEVRRRIPAGGK